MRKILILFTLIVCSTLSFSEGATGYWGINFGTPKANVLEFFKSKGFSERPLKENNNGQSVRLVHPELKLFGYKVSNNNVYLEFDQNLTLNTITFFLENITKRDTVIILDVMTNTYGYKYTFKEDFNEDSISYIFMFDNGSAVVGVYYFKNDTASINILGNNF